MTGLVVPKALRVVSAEKGTRARQLSETSKYDERRLQIALVDRSCEVVSSLPPDGLEAGLRGFMKLSLPSRSLCR